MKNKKGQAMTEYLLLIAVIFGVLLVFKDLFLDHKKSVTGLVLRGVKCEVEIKEDCSKAGQAHRGGRKYLGQYYRGTSGASIIRK
jgi:hypothetical protein